MTGRDVSIVISTRDRADRLGRALAHLVRQNAPHVRHEIVVVDNGSSDHTPAVVRSYVQAHHGFVRGIVEPRPGVSAGRNAGISVADAPLVAFTDDDVCAREDWVAETVRLARAYPAVDGFGGRVLPRWPVTPPRWLDRRHWSPVALTDHGDRPFDVSARNPKCLIAANLVVRRAMFDRIGGFSEAFPRSQDHEWELRCWGAGGTGLYAPSLVVTADVDPERMTRGYHRRWHRQHGQACARMRLRERIAPGGTLQEPVKSARLLDAPRFVCRQLLEEAVRCAAHAVLDPGGSRGFHHANEVRHLVAYLRESRRVQAAQRAEGTPPATWSRQPASGAQLEGGESLP